MPVPFLAVKFGAMLDGIHQRPAQAVPALQVGIDNLKADFVDTRAAQQYVGAELAHSSRNLKVGFRPNAQIVFLRAHAAAKTEFADENSRLAPGTAQSASKTLIQHVALVAALSHPGAAGI